MTDHASKRKSVLALALAVVFALAAPVFAQPAPAPGAAAVTAAQADLDALFAALGSAHTEAEANSISTKIWKRWLQPDDPVLAELMNDAIAAHAIGNVARTYELLDVIIERYPDYAEGWNRRATLNYETGHFHASLDDIEQTLKREPRHFGALSGRALDYLALGERDRARKAVEEARKIHPFIAAHPPFSDLVEPMVRI